jgi:uncharacterized membrane protein YccC
MRLIERMKKSLADETPNPRTVLNVDHRLMRFLSGRRVPLGQIFTNLTMASPNFRHALRVTVAVAIGFWLGRILPLTNAYWIVMTTLIIMKPGYSLTKQRNVQRIIGTAIGCAISIALIVFVKMPHLLIAVMFASMVMSYSLLLFNYGASVVFTSSYVLLLFHLLAPGSLRIIGERAIDTGIGCALAIAASHLFPYWEYRLMGKLVTDMLAATRQYLEASWWWGKQPAGASLGAAAVAAAAGAMEAAGTVAPAAVPSPAPDAGATAAGPTSASTVGQEASAAFDGDLRYRLARKDVHVAFANLAGAFRRMMIEPKAHQKFVAELNDLIVQSHALAAQITAAAPVLRNVAQQDGDGTQALQRALSAVREHLVRAQAGEAPPSDQAEATKQLMRELDAMVVEIERSGRHTAEFVQDLKVLAHQCKQMLAASVLIRKDAGVIRLPAA